VVVARLGQERHGLLSRGTRVCLDCIRQREPMIICRCPLAVVTLNRSDPAHCKYLGLYASSDSSSLLLICGLRWRYRARIRVLPSEKNDATRGWMCAKVTKSYRSAPEGRSASLLRTHPQAHRKG
jgi:hypothetical protein